MADMTVDLTAVLLAVVTVLMKAASSVNMKAGK